MPTIAQLYSQNLVLPAAAQKFVAQSPTLKEEAYWEKRKAIFYAKFPGADAFELLSKMSPSEASRVIAKKTARHEHEVVLEPLETGIDHSMILCMLNNEIKSMCNNLSGRASSERDSYVRSQKPVEKYTSFGATSQVREQKSIDSISETWRAEIHTLQKNMEAFTEIELFLFHLGHSRVRYEPRTERIHIKTELISDVESDLSKRASKLYSRDKCTQGTGSDVHNFSAEYQLERFELGLHKFGTGPFKMFDTMYNVGSLQAFCFCVPYSDICPSTCGAALVNHGKYTDIDWKILSIPNTSGFPQAYHNIRVYCSKIYIDYVKPRAKGSNSILERYKPYEFCFNCFSMAHQSSSSRCPKKEDIYGDLGY